MIFKPTQFFQIKLKMLRFLKAGRLQKFCVFVYCLTAQFWPKSAAKANLNSFRILWKGILQISIKNENIFHRFKPLFALLKKIRTSPISSLKLRLSIKGQNRSKMLFILVCWFSYETSQFIFFLKSNLNE